MEQNRNPVTPPSKNLLESYNPFKAKVIIATPAKFKTIFLSSKFLPFNSI
jgi:hypothetical protein